MVKRQGMGLVTTSSVVLTSLRNLLLLKALSAQEPRLSSSQSQEDRGSAWCSVMTLMVWDGRWVQEREGICIYIVGSLYGTAETNNTVKQLCSN